MNVMRLIVASVATQDVFKRFAQLSKKDKETVINKVKEKVNGKGKSKKDEEPPEEEAVEEEVKDETVEETESDTGTTEEVAPDTEEQVEGESKSLENLVGDLAEEIEVIKTDGQISPSEVVGLIDNVVQMVHTLLQAKPGKPKKASREDDIAQRIADEAIEVEL